MRDAVPPGGQVGEAAGVHVATAVGLGEVFWVAVAVAVAVTRTVGLGVGAWVIVADLDGVGDPMATRGWDGWAPPLANGPIPNRADERMTRDRITSATPAIVQSGTPPSRPP